MLAIYCLSPIISNEIYHSNVTDEFRATNIPPKAQTHNKAKTKTQVKTTNDTTFFYAHFLYTQHPTFINSHYKISSSRHGIPSTTIQPNTRRHSKSPPTPRNRQLKIRIPRQKLHLIIPRRLPPLSPSHNPGSTTTTTPRTIIPDELRGRRRRLPPRINPPLRDGCEM